MRLIAAGDISLNGRYHASLASRRKDPLRRIEGWNSSDLIVGNLESPITQASRVAPTKCTLRGSQHACGVFAANHIQVLSIANNHMMDFGPDGLFDTQKYLDDCNVRYCGGGKDLAEASRPLVVVHRDQRVGFLSFCDVEQISPLYAGVDSPGVAPWLGEESLDLIRSVRSDVDWLVVMFHWGVEMSQLPSVSQRELARLLVRAGADVILGHHPHVLQPFEEIDGSLVAYSLGNFLFSPMYWKGVKPDNSTFCSKLRLHPLSRRTGWLEVELQTDRRIAWRFHPARLTRSLELAPGWPTKWRDEWQLLLRAFSSVQYEEESTHEIARGHQRTQSRWHCRSLWRRIDMKLYQYGLIQRGLNAL